MMSAREEPWQRQLCCPQETPSLWTSMCLGIAPAITFCSTISSWQPRWWLFATLQGFTRALPLRDPTLPSKSVSLAAAGSSIHQPGQHINASAPKQLCWANASQFQKYTQPSHQAVLQRLNTHRHRWHLSPPQPRCGPALGKPSKAMPTGCRLRLVLPLQQYLAPGSGTPYGVNVIKFLGEGDFYFKPN